MTTIEQVTYGGWANCTRLSDGVIELIVTNDVGPRVIRCGFVNEANLFCEMADHIGKTGGDKWRLYGGHRLWHAPEHPVRSYFPDNAPIEVSVTGDAARFSAPIENNGIQKTITIQLTGQNSVQLTHRLTNHLAWPVTCAPWSLSVMAAGGTAIIPVPPRGTHPADLLPSHTLTIWPYTDMSDPRWTWGREYVLLRQDLNATTPQKFGIAHPQAWLAYANHDTLFAKCSQHALDGVFPDLNSALEVFTNAFMLELETLAPLATLAPGASVEHNEHWRLWPAVAQPRTELDVKRYIAPLLDEW